MAGDRPVLGIILMLCFCVLAPFADAIAKTLGGTIPLFQLLLARFALQAIFLSPIVAVTNRPWRTSRRMFWLTALRTVLHLIGVGAMFTALQYLPFADAVAIAFVMPFIMLLLGKFVLGEEVGSLRLLACLVGFIGTLLVIQPSFSEVGLPALLPLVVAVDFALFMLVTRQIAKEIDPISLQCVSGWMATAGLVLVLATVWQISGLEGVLILPSQFDTILLVTIGLVGTAAHLLMTWSLRYAPSATLAPMQYLEIPFATIIGYLVFGDFPNGLAALGIAITIAAGLFVIYREHENMSKLN